MSIGISPSDVVFQACRLPNQATHYDKMDRFLRANVSVCEESGSLQKRHTVALARIIEGKA